MFKNKSSPGGSKPTKSPEQPTFASETAPPAGKPKSPKKKAKSKKEGGGGGIFGLLIPILLIAAIAAGGYYVYINFLSGNGAPSVQGLTSLIPGQGGANESPQENPPPQDLPTQEPPVEQPQAGVPPAEQAPEQSAQAENQQAPEPTPQPLAFPGPTPADVAALQAESDPAKQVNCEGRMKFLEDIGLADDAQISTSEEGVRGLILLGAPRQGGGVTRYQHQTWSTAGFLDAFVMARNGDVYFAPNPRTGLGVDAPQNQDHVFKLETRTGALVDLLTVPAASPTSPENPFGVIGLAYDCESNSLYVMSVAGSTVENQAGKILHIDLNTGAVVEQIDNLDAFGAAVHQTETARRLYFGSPRTGEIRALDLSDEGSFQGEPRTVATLPEPLRAHTLAFPDADTMVVKAVEFNFANAEIPPGTEIRFQHDPTNDSWVQVP